MKCETVRDLLPLYSENLVSENTAKDVKLHLDTCDRCRKIYEDMKLPAEEIKVPEESKAMKKVNGKLKKRKRLAVFLTIVIIGVFGILGFLTYGEITKKTTVNFSTIFQTIEVKKLAKKIGNGDFDSYVSNNLNTRLEVDKNIFVNMANNKLNFEEDLINSEVKELESLYNKAFGDTKVSEINVYTANIFFNSEYLGEDWSLNGVLKNVIFSDLPVYNVIRSDVRIHFENGNLLGLEVTKGEYGHYYIDNVYIDEYSTYGNLENIKEFVKCFNNFANHDDTIRYGFVKHYIEIEESSKRHNVFEKYFVDPQKTKTSFEAFFEKGYDVVSCEIGDMRYDEEKKMLYNELFITAEDGEGSAVMQTRLYKNIHGFILPEKLNVKVYSRDCTDELVKDMKNMFE